MGGTFSERDIIECVRSSEVIPTIEVDGILTIKTCGSASDIEESEELLEIIRDIKNGLTSPIIEITPYLKKGCKNDNESMMEDLINATDKYEVAIALQPEANPLNSKDQQMRNQLVLLMNGSKLQNEERARLYCRRFVYCDTNILKVMHGREEYGGFPNLPTLNEDNIVADLAKFRRKLYKRNDPPTTMNSSPFFRVFCDGYCQNLGTSS